MSHQFSYWDRRWNRFFWRNFETHWSVLSSFPTVCLFLYTKHYMQKHTQQWKMTLDIPKPHASTQDLITLTQILKTITTIISIVLKRFHYRKHQCLFWEKVENNTNKLFLNYIKITVPTSTVFYILFTALLKKV